VLTIRPRSQPDFIMRALVILAALILAAGPVAAQEKLRDGDKLQQEINPDRDAAEAARDLMTRTLPFKDGQVLRYYNGKGEIQGFARRNRLTIRFYESDGTYVGRAERVSQSATAYYDADGRYMGRRLHTKQTTRARTTNDSDYESGSKGFRETTKPMGQPGEE
jgi:hypothetical protein